MHRKKEFSYLLMSTLESRLPKIATKVKESNFFRLEKYEIVLIQEALMDEFMEFGLNESANEPNKKGLALDEFIGIIINNPSILDEMIHEIKLSINSG